MDRFPSQSPISKVRVAPPGKTFNSKGTRTFAASFMYVPVRQVVELWPRFVDPSDPRVLEVTASEFISCHVTMGPRFSGGFPVAGKGAQFVHILEGCDSVLGWFAEIRNKEYGISGGTSAAAGSFDATAKRCLRKTTVKAIRKCFRGLSR